MIEKQSFTSINAASLNAPEVEYRCSVVEQGFKNGLCALDFSTTQKFGTNKISSGKLKLCAKKKKNPKD